MEHLSWSSPTQGARQQVDFFTRSWSSLFKGHQRWGPSGYPPCARSLQEAAGCPGGGSAEHSPLPDSRGLRFPWHIHAPSLLTTHVQT